jgi:hypothetical protein
MGVTPILVLSLISDNKLDKMGFTKFLIQQ